MLSLPNDQRLEILNFFKKFGEPNAILRELAAIPPCVQTKTMEVRINQKYVFAHRSKSFLVKPFTWLYRIIDLKFCYLAYEGTSLNVIGVVGKNGVHLEFTLEGGTAALTVFNRIRSYVTDFETLPPYPPQERNAPLTVDAHIHINSHYHLQNDRITLEYKSFFGRPKSELIVQNINQIIWCSQLLEVDSEAGDSHVLQLYCLGQSSPRRMYFPSNISAFAYVLELKRRVPHLLYGFNPEYEALFNRNPSALLALANRNRPRR